MNTYRLRIKLSHKKVFSSFKDIYISSISPKNDSVNRIIVKYYVNDAIKYG